MKIIVTGSTGHISQPLTKELVAKGHSATVVSSNPEKMSAIEALGAKAAIGSLEDPEFLKETFKEAEAVYTMIPPPNFMDPSLDMNAFYFKIANNYAAAIQSAGIKRVVHLSSIGAHMEQGSGIILVHHTGEKIMAAIPNIALTIMRPTSFYYNLYAFVPAIKHSGMMVSNYGGSDLVSWVSTNDIAAAVAEELMSPDSTQSKIRYVASQEVTCDELAGILGTAIGKPDLKWIVASDDQIRAAYEGYGMSHAAASGLVEMNAKIHSGELLADYRRNKPAVMGKTKLTEFAKEFAAAYNAN